MKTRTVKLEKRLDDFIKGVSRKEGKQAYKILSNPDCVWNEMMTNNLFDASYPMQDIYEIFDIE